MVLIGSSSTAAASKKHMEHLFSILLNCKIFALWHKISEDFQLTRESTDHHNSELETGRVKGTLCWEGGRAGQLMLVLELLTHRVSLSQGNTRLPGLGLVTPAEARACPCNFCLL